jgi:hypothetical protein
MRVAKHAATLANMGFLLVVTRQAAPNALESYNGMEPRSLKLPGQFSAGGLFGCCCSVPGFPRLCSLLPPQLKLRSQASSRSISKTLASPFRICRHERVALRHGTLLKLRGGFDYYADGENVDDIDFGEDKGENEEEYGYSDEDAKKEIDADYEQHNGADVRVEEDMCEWVHREGQMIRIDAHEKEVCVCVCLGLCFVCVWD